MASQQLFFIQLAGKIIPSALDDEVTEYFTAAKARGESERVIALFLRDALRRVSG